MTLRKITEHDAPYLIAWRNANAKWFPPGPEITPESHAAWYGEYLANPFDHMYMVCDPVKIGTVAVNIQDHSIHRVLRGREGGAKNAMSRALLELMSIYGFRMYTLQVMEGNARAIDFYKRLGFYESGRQRGRGGVMMINMHRWHA